MRKIFIILAILIFPVFVHAGMWTEGFLSVGSSSTPVYPFTMIHSTPQFYIANTTGNVVYLIGNDGDSFWIKEQGDEIKMRFDGINNEIFFYDGIAINTNTLEFNLTLDNDGGIMARGVVGEGNTLTTSGAGTRLMWYPRKAAFRMGYVDGSQWDDANVYAYSVAMGYNTYTTGEGSVAMGKNTTATGTAALALGEDTTASDNWAVAMGNNTTASGQISTAMGSATTASGVASTAMGANTTASGWGSFTAGEFTEATATLSTTIGRYLTNNTRDSFMVGFSTYQITTPSFAVLKSSVGIGTATPDERLHIAGNIKIDNNIINIVGALTDDTVTVDDLAHDIDATGIGFDADKVDGLDASAFIQLSATQTFTGSNTFSNTGNIFYGDGSGLHGVEGTQLALFLSGTSSDIGGRYVMSSIPTGNTSSTFTVIGASAGETVISSFTTISNSPGVTTFIDGIHHFHFHAKKTGTKDVIIKAKIYKRTSGGAETLLYTLEDSSNLTTSEADYDIHHFNVAIELDITDRIVVQVICIVSGSGSAPDVSLYAEGNYVTRMEFPALTPTVETFVPYSGALKDIDINNKAITNIDWLSSNNAWLQISTNVYITGYSSATTYYGDGSNLTGIAAGGDMLKSTYDTDDSGIVDNSELLDGRDYLAFVSTAGDTMSGNLDMGDYAVRYINTGATAGSVLWDSLYGDWRLGTNSTPSGFSLENTNFGNGRQLMIYNGSVCNFVLGLTSFSMNKALSMSNNAITNINWANSDDGSGSLLDADKLDGQDSLYFAVGADLTTETNSRITADNRIAVDTSTLRTDLNTEISDTNTDFSNVATDSTTLKTEIDLKQDELSTLTSLLTISTNVYIVGYSSATTYYGDGSNLTGIAVAGDNLGDHTATQSLGMSNNKIINLSTNPVSLGDVIDIYYATSTLKSYDSNNLDGRGYTAFVSTAGDTMSGNLAFIENSKITMTGTGGQYIDVGTGRVYTSILWGGGGTGSISFSELDGGNLDEITNIDMTANPGIEPWINMRDGYILSVSTITFSTGQLDMNNQEILNIDWANSDDGSGSELDADFLDGKNYIGFITPVGAIIAYGGASAPDGWVLCDGSSLVRTGTYADLFAAIGTTFGTVDGSHFNIPDMRGIFPRGSGTHGSLTNANGAAFAGTLGTYQNDKMQGHFHSNSRVYNAGGGGAGYVPLSSAWGDTSSRVTDTDNDKILARSPVTDGANGTPRSGTETNPANLGVNYIIKY